MKKEFRHYNPRLNPDYHVKNNFKIKANDNRINIQWKYIKQYEFYSKHRKIIDKLNYMGLSQTNPISYQSIRFTRQKQKINNSIALDNAITDSINPTATTNITNTINIFKPITPNLFSYTNSLELEIPYTIFIKGNQVFEFKSLMLNKSFQLSRIKLDFYLPTFTTIKRSDDSLVKNFYTNLRVQKSLKCLEIICSNIYNSRIEYIIKDYGIASICNPLKHLTQLIILKLDFSYSKISNEGIMSVLQILQRNNQLKTFEIELLYCDNINDDLAQMLALGLKDKSQTLTNLKIKLKSNLITDKTCNIFLENCSQLTSLQTLHLILRSPTKFHFKDTLNFAQLASLQNLKDLSLDFNGHYTLDDLHQIITMIKFLPNLEKFKIDVQYHHTYFYKELISHNNNLLPYEFPVVITHENFNYVKDIFLCKNDKPKNISMEFKPADHCKIIQELMVDIQKISCVTNLNLDFKYFNQDINSYLVDYLAHATQLKHVIIHIGSFNINTENEAIANARNLIMSLNKLTQLDSLQLSLISNNITQANHNKYLKIMSSLSSSSSSLIDSSSQTSSGLSSSSSQIDFLVEFMNNLKYSKISSFILRLDKYLDIFSYKSLLAKLGNTFKNIKSLNSLNLEIIADEITVTNYKLILKSIAKMNKLKILKLSIGYIVPDHEDIFTRDEILRNMAKELNNLKQLETLDLFIKKKCMFLAEDVKIFCNNIQYLPQLTTFSFGIQNHSTKISLPDLQLTEKLMLLSSVNNIKTYNKYNLIDI